MAAGGADIMDGGDAAEVVARTHARHGTTALLATTVTASPETRQRTLVARRGLPGALAGGARIVGAHLEGPYINERSSARSPISHAPPPAARSTASSAWRRFASLTLAPGDVRPRRDHSRTLAARGVRVQIGHTAGTYEDGVAALAHGATSFTHLFNAMTGLHHRAPGIVGAALAHAEYAEMIPDLLHVHPGAIRAALRAIPRLFCVTDATSATGMPDGDYRLGAHTVPSASGGVRLAGRDARRERPHDGRALRNLVSVGLTIEDASNGSLTTRPST